MFRTIHAASTHALGLSRTRASITSRTLSTSSSTLSNSPYHDLFRLPERKNPFIVDLGLLKRNFLQAQRTAHPDAAIGNNLDSASQSAEINKAYQTLLSPLRRAEYLLSLKGFELEEEAKLDGGADPENQAFIMEVLDARSALEDAQSEEEVAEIRRENKIRMQEESRILEEAFSNEAYEDALKATIRLRYWTGLEDAARDITH